MLIKYHIKVNDLTFPQFTDNMILFCNLIDIYAFSFILIIKTGIMTMPAKKNIGRSSSSPLLYLSTSLLFLIVSLTLFIRPLFAIDSLSYKVGQMVMTSFSAYQNYDDTVYYDIKNRNLGSIILFSSQLQNKTQIAGLCDQLQQNADTPLLIAIDQEGGRVARLNANTGFQNTYTPYYLGTVLDDISATQDQAALMAGWMRKCKLNVNLAPVIDVNVNPSSPVIGGLERSFSSDPDKVYDHANRFFLEFYNRGIFCAIKHYPGHGSALNDSHEGFTDITETWQEYELQPYRDFVNSGYRDMVMTGHLFNANIDSLYPASISEKAINGLLRDSLGFNGVVISDAMSMGAITQNYSFQEAALLAIKAGTDILLYTQNGYDYQGRSIVKEVTRVVKKAIAEGDLEASLIDDAYDRVMTLKSRIRTDIGKPDIMLADEFDLKAYPNPFNPITNISFRVDDDLYETAQLLIFSSDGRLVQRYFLTINGTGDYGITWHATDLYGRKVPSGTYVYGLQVGGKLHTGKMTLLK